MTRLVRAALALFALAVLGAPALAQYPNRPITMIVAYPAGGGTDLTARLIATFIERYLGGGQRIVVLNRPGAGGEIGFNALSNAEPDGYTIGFINTPGILSIPIERRSPLDWRRFDLLGNIIDDPSGFSVHADSEIRSLADLVEFARRNPDEVTVGTTGIGSDDHLAMLAFQRLAGVRMTHVPFSGAAQTRQALQGRHVVVGSINVGEALQYVAGGSPFRNLGQMSESRLEMAAQIPTFRELGFDMVFSSLRGIAAPRGLPPEIRDRLVQAIAQAAADPEFQRRSRETYAPLRYLAPDAYAAELQATDAALRRLWAEAPWAQR
jgi:tripartite-type tricarboxylate transporter receptor subunit TctC